MSARRWFAAFALQAVLASPALADPTPSLVRSIYPESPTTQHFVTVRTVFTGCLNALGADDVVVDLAAHRIDVYLAYGDDVCVGPFVVDRVSYIHVGFLPAGHYDLRFMSCGMPFDPDAVCEEETWIPHLLFTVAEAGPRRRVIPASSPPANAGMIAALLALALLVLRRRAR